MTSPNSILSRNLSKLLPLPNVVGVCTGTKKRVGVDTGIPCITVLVRRKLPITELTVDSIVPPLIENIPTDVIEVGDIVALGENPHLQRHRPLVGGISIGRSNYLSAGTLGLPLLYDREGAMCLLSNNHVLAMTYLAVKPIEGELVRQPSILDGGTEEDYIATLKGWVPIEFGDVANKMDAAYARLTQPARTEMLGLGTYGAVHTPEVGLAVRKSGRTSGVTMSQIAYTDAMVIVDYAQGAFQARFEGQLIAMPAFMKPGDSGSVFIDKENKIVALGFAGSDRVSIGTPIQIVLDSLGLSLSPPGEPIELALKSIEGEYQNLWRYDAPTRSWQTYVADRPRELNDLTTLRPGEGYWLKVKRAVLLNRPGKAIMLSEGWNLIGG